ncbi:hypothetical protein [Streptomyces sp. SYSU K21746]
MRSLTYDIEFRRRAKRTQVWGFGLLSGAALLWLWTAILLLAPYEVERERYSSTECESRFFTDDATANRGAYNGSTCAAERDWPEVLGVLGLSVPLGVVGAVLYTSGSVSNRMSEHAAEITRLNEAATR